MKNSIFGAPLNSVGYYDDAQQNRSIAGSFFIDQRKRLYFPAAADSNNFYVQ